MIKRFFCVLSAFAVLVFCLVPFFAVAAPTSAVSDPEAVTEETSPEPEAVHQDRAASSSGDQEEESKAAAASGEKSIPANMLQYYGDFPVVPCNSHVSTIFSDLELYGLKLCNYPNGASYYVGQQQSNGGFIVVFRVNNSIYFASQDMKASFLRSTDSGNVNSANFGEAPISSEGWLYLVYSRAYTNFNEVIPVYSNVGDALDDLAVLSDVGNEQPAQKATLDDIADLIEQVNNLSCVICFSIGILAGISASKLFWGQL